MDIEWITTPGASEALLFFNGFGMDTAPFQFLKTEGLDLVYCGNYKNLDLSADLCDRLSAYSRVSVAAYSLGVWAWGALQKDLPPITGKRVMIGGTGCPIHPRLGIPAPVFSGTLKNFDEVGRQKFFENVAGDAPTWEILQKGMPLRSLENQRQELQALWERLSEGEDSAPHADHVFVGQKDRIFPAANQKRYWEGKAPLTLLESGHFPFPLWKTWKEILHAP